MNPTDASRTAFATALMRAAHTRIDPAPLLDDAWSDRLLPDAVRQGFFAGALERMDEPMRARAQAAPGKALDHVMRANAAYADVILRQRYTEDALQAAAARGIAQYVLIGAGFDSFACRCPAFAKDITIFEVDHPATQNFKRQRMADCGIHASDTLHFVPADLSRESLKAALAPTPFRADQPAFFSWLGVTVYLDRASNLAALRDIATAAARGSELVFTYVDEVVFDPAWQGTEAFAALRSNVASVGEAFLSGFVPTQMGQVLRDAGLELLEDLNGVEQLARYDASGINRLHAAAEAHIVHARVG